MFVYTKKLTAKAADALDLFIEFVTLGEYGLEYPDGLEDGGAGAFNCRSGRDRPPMASPANPRTVRPAPSDPRHRALTNCRRTTRTRLPEALRPPRITLDLKH